jgi:chromosomal replication initiator protein DnaA
VVDRHRGGEGVLKKTLEDVKKYAFSGYVRLEFELNVDRAEGLLAFGSGEPLLALYVYKKGSSRVERVYVGGKAVEFIWEDSLLPECEISLHSRVSTKEMDKAFPDARIGKTELAPPAYLVNPRNVGDVKKLSGRADETAHRILEWAKEGYIVNNLIRMYISDPPAAARAIPYFESNIQRLEGLEEILRFLDTQGYEREAESLMRKMRDPEHLLDVESDLEALRRRIEEYDKVPEETPQAQIQRDLERKKIDEKIDGVYDLIMQYHKQITQPEASRADACPRCGGALDAKGVCATCPPSKDKPRFGQPFNPRFTLDSFVSGPNSRFAEAAARAVAQSPGRSYNPLFVYSRSGLGKTHLLQAIGNHISKNLPSKVIILSPTDMFESELIGAIQDKTLDAMHEAYRHVDVLLLDDAQFLAGKERMQEELFQTFNAIMERGGQVVLTSDRPPKEIPSLSERLVTRFESGLIADIQPPDLETRMAILERRVRAERLNVPRDVLALIAENCKDNVRQLEGGLNRVIAFSSLLKADITLEKAQEILGVEKAKVERKPVPKAELTEGHSYLVEEEKPDTAHRVLLNKAREGFAALGILRSHPKTLKAKAGGLDLTLLWLTDRETTQERTVPPSLERLVSIIESFMEEKGRCIILLDDIQYLVSNNSFEGVVRFLRNIVDSISEREAIFMVSLSPESLGSQERSILEREMEVLRPTPIEEMKL